jgi:hypothetical protein
VRGLVDLFHRVPSARMHDGTYPLGVRAAGESAPPGGDPGFPPLPAPGEAAAPPGHVVEGHG